jgi:hypothetical protein
LPGTFTLKETSSSNAFDPGLLTLTIKDGATTLYDDDFGGLADDALVDLGEYAAGASRTYTFTVALDAAAPNTQQGRSASAAYQWVATQLDGETFDQ